MPRGLTAKSKNGMRIKKELSLSFRFHLPPVIDYVNYGGKTIVIAREEGNWIVLDNAKQLSYFKSLRAQTIGEAMRSTGCSEEDAKWVVTQLIARHFDGPVKRQELTPVMQLYLTNSCNMRCPHCYMNAGKAYENELSTEEIFQILDAYKQNGGVDVKLTGGEISLRKDLFDIVKYGADIGLHMELLTNGTLWSRAKIEKIVPYITVVQISVDGYNEEENAKVRGKGNFQKALNAIHHFATSGAKVHVAMTAYYSPDLSEKADHYATFAKELKEKYQDYGLEVFIATGLLPGRYGELSQKEAEAYTAATQTIYSRYQGCQSFIDEGFIGRHKAGVILTNCSYGYPSVASNGDVFMCPILSATQSVANIRTTPLNEIMEMCNYAHTLSETENLTPCNQCELKSICGGDCRIRYFTELKRSDIMNVSAPVRRTCSKEIKNGFYELMIKTNAEIFH